MAFYDPLTIALLLLGGPALLVNLAALMLRPEGRDAAQGLAMAGWPRRGLAETRLRTSGGLRAVLAVMLAGLTLALVRLNGGALPGWPELALLAVLGWNALALALWELRFDPVGLSVPVLIFRRRARLWRQLVAVTDDSPFALRFHFADGAVIRVPKHVVGGSELLHMAEQWIPPDQAPPHARTARG